MTLTPYKRKAFYYETDRMDIIHHSNYVRWLEEARVDLMEQLGCPFHEIEARGIVQIWKMNICVISFVLILSRY